jgi:protein-tyrosine phosphatase
MTVFFDPVSDDMHSVIQKGKSVVVHCKASLCRASALILAYVMKYHKMTLMEAGKLLKSKWDATWPCDRFAFMYKRELRRIRKRVLNYNSLRHHQELSFQI